MSSPHQSSQKQNINDKTSQIMHNSDKADSRAYQPVNLANVFCDMFADHPEALIDAFCDDINMFEYLYQYLPREIIIDVLNNLPTSDAVQIVRRCSCPHDIYEKVDPLLYVVRYFSDVVGTKNDIENCKIMNNAMLKKRGKYCEKFNYSIIPHKSRLNFALECKTYLKNNDFVTLLDLLENVYISK